MNDSVIEEAVYPILISVQIQRPHFIRAALAQGSKAVSSRLYKVSSYHEIPDNIIRIYKKIPELNICRRTLVYSLIT